MFEESRGLDTRKRVVDHHRSAAEPWYRWVFRQIHLPEKSHILDLGSGPGDLWVENWEILSPDWRIVAADQSSGMTAEAAHRIEKAASLDGLANGWGNGQFNFVTLDAVCFPFERRRWDVILALGLLDLISDVEAVLDQIWKGLKPGGMLYVSAGGYNHLQEFEALFSPFLPELPLGGDPTRFGLDNGVKILSSRFEDIFLVRYFDELVFRQVEPIIAYAMSEEVVREQLTKRNKACLENHVKEFLEEQGELRVMVEKGVFGATKCV